MYNCRSALTDIKALELNPTEQMVKNNEAEETINQT